jgi:tetratricopeptide (TPR) repeat protein
MERAYAQSGHRLWGRRGLSLERALDAAGHDIASAKRRSARTAVQVALASRLHQMVKAGIPRFSLDRGFEFANVVRYGERQCFLQSVIIAGLLQSAGVDAGVAMVYKNTQGEETNNGHAVVLVKLPNGQDAIVDASHEEPFVRQMGLFVTAPRYRYADPVYEEGSDRIRCYRPASGGGELNTAEVRTLDIRFIQSQFWYYRGERAPGGLISAHRTRQGLEAARNALCRSVELCPENPLSVYMLGRVYLSQGSPKQARKLLERAYELYRRFGWVPQGPKEYLKLANQAGRSRARA